ncbi:hypothetical protein C0Q70_01596 [Pomacea canaliculata]|uniref:Uncharacterized protein n=1 Tax=Pomacea canaliculata TaxID=400727 RepID=A0A2T7PZX5_POMCA|nr:hypothetical protein C0Q70_01596 [Pomacea canaliculata]
MPISSGALEWPKSYFRKPVETEADSSRTDEGLEWWWGVKSPRGVAPLNYEWQPQLSAREDYEKWRKEMDRKVHSKEVVENPPKGGNRDDPRKVIRRRRRRVCCCLTLWLSLLFLLIAAAVVFVFIYLTG